MNKYSYIHEKFSLAVRSLATSPSSIQKRVGNAYRDHLVYLEAEELPAEIREDFQHMAEQLTRVQPLGDEGSIQATVNNMSTEEAIAIAEKINDLADIITASYYSTF